MPDDHNAVQHSPLMQAKNLRLAIAAVRNVAREDLAIVLGTMLFTHSFQDISNALTAANRQVEKLK